MKRALCNRCVRPLKTCICKHVVAINNSVPLIILQHPQESTEVKNTAGLLQLCLKNSQLFVAETFDPQFFSDLDAEDHYDILLYPPTADEKSLGIASAPVLDLQRVDNGEKLRLWVIDATWRKSRKMLYLNPALQHMPRLNLQDCPESIYKIRKSHSKNQLSTFEASCYALTQLEHKSIDYTAAIQAFAAFVDEQHSLSSRDSFLPQDPL